MIRATYVKNYQDALEQQVVNFQSLNWVSQLCSEPFNY